MTIPYTHERYLTQRDKILKRQREKYRIDPVVREKKRLYDIEYRQRVKEKLGTTFTKAKREAHYKHRYGISIAIYNTMFEAQKGQCAVCYRDDRKLVIDHDHVTKKVRGLLCKPCNAGLGHFNDDPEALEAAAQYLEKGGFYREWEEKI